MTVSGVTVFIVDDDEAMRDSLCLLVSTRTDFRVEGYESAEAFLAAYQPTRAGCLLLDVRMPGMSGPELQQRLAAEHAEIPIIFLSGHGDIRMVEGAIQHGAVDFIEKPASDQVLLERVRRAVQLDGQRRRERAMTTKLTRRLAELKARERQVMDLLISGRTSKESAAELRISLPAVSMYRGRILQKLQADNVVDLTRRLLAQPHWRECTT